VNGQPAEVLVVDDEEVVLNAACRVLTRAGFRVTGVSSAREGLQLLHQGQRVDVIVTDLKMPAISGIEFLRLVRQLHLDLPVIVLTGNPSFESAVAVIDYGGFRYLEKPPQVEELVRTVREAAAVHLLAALKRRALQLGQAEGWLIGDRAGLDARFEQALEHLWIAYQPIIKWPDQEVFGHEALVRSDEPSLSTPGLLFDAAERLGRVHDLGRRIRRTVADDMQSAPGAASVFVNISAAELIDDELYQASAPLSTHAERVVLEFTERTSLDGIRDVRSRVLHLRSLGYRIAVDDLGTGYAGLTSFSQLQPDIAKLDISLVREVHGSARKADIVRSMIDVCTNQLDRRVVCEGVETESERDALEALGAELLQGYLFGRPSRGFRTESLFASGT
jgi:EAL domain-containing protein (putative c-di-GMP-specific phosphodiesterase class I)